MYGYCLVTMSALRRRPHTGIAIRLILRRVKAERQQGSWSASYRWVGAAVVAPSHQPTEHPTDKGRSTPCHEAFSGDYDQRSDKPLANGGSWPWNAQQAE